jgi:histidinol-phosphate phosphatase family protein
MARLKARPVMSMWCIGRARRELVGGILLDRDGTIIEDYHYVGRIERVQFKPGAIEAIRRFNEAGIPVAIVTNQSGVARGFYAEADVNQVHEYIHAELGKRGAYVDMFLYSPHHPDGNVPEYIRDTPYHKPAPGMAFQASAAMGLDLKKCIVVGDRPEDIRLAHVIGAHGIYLGQAKLPGWIHPAEYSKFNSLADAAGFIIERITGTSMDEFPVTEYPDPISYFDHYRTNIEQALIGITPSNIHAASDVLFRAYSDGSAIWTAGNGGAAAIAEHMATDHAKHMSAGAEFYQNIHSLTSNTALLTAIANDIGYDAVFSWQLEQFASSGDVLVIFSVSGNSPNVVRALQCAVENGINSIAIVGGNPGSAATKLADIVIRIASQNYGIAEDVMSIIQHSLAQYIRQSHMNSEQIKSTRF